MKKIDADALITKIKELAKRVQHNPDTCNGLGGAVAIIMEMPTIEEQIMCEDCIWWTKSDASLQGRCSMFGIYPTGTWYCANAERKGVAEE